jgi:hypothetical protein
MDLNTVHGGPGPPSSLPPRLMVHLVHLVVSLLLFPCFLYSAMLTLAASGQAHALGAQGQNS